MATHKFTSDKNSSNGNKSKQQYQCFMALMKLGRGLVNCWGLLFLMKAIVYHFEIFGVVSLQLFIIKK